MDQFSKLEEENRRLKAQLDSIENNKKDKWSKRYRFSKGIASKFLGAKLKNAIHAFFIELQEDKKVTKDTVSELLAALFIRVTRIGAFLLITTLLPTLLILLQVYYLKNQNRLITTQNERIKQQAFLQEADRRSYMFGVLDQIIKEVVSEASKTGGSIYKKSAIRLVAISKNLKPYHYLENDKLTESLRSPERGYLLMSLLENNVNLNTIIDNNITETLSEALDLEYTDLKKASLTDKPLKKINLQFSNLQETNFYKTSLSRCNLSNAYLQNTIFGSCNLKRVDFSNTNLLNASFQNSELEKVKFIGANLKNTNFKDSEINKVDFTKANIVNAKFDNASVSADFMEVMEKQLSSESFDYLEDNYTLKINKKRGLLVKR